MGHNQNDILYISKGAFQSRFFFLLDLVIFNIEILRSILHLIFYTIFRKRGGFRGIRGFDYSQTQKVTQTENIKGKLLFLA